MKPRCWPDRFLSEASEGQLAVRLSPGCWWALAVIGTPRSVRASLRSLPPLSYGILPGVSPEFPLHIKRTVLACQFAKAAATRQHKLSDRNNKMHRLSVWRLEVQNQAIDRVGSF